MSILQTSQLVKEYQMGEVTVHALRGVDFVVNQGEFIAIMGASGSGKSTLLHLLGGLIRPRMAMSRWRGSRSRIEALNKQYPEHGILISEWTYEALGSHRAKFDLLSLGKVDIRGKAEGVGIWAVKGLARA